MFGGKSMPPLRVTPSVLLPVLALACMITAVVDTVSRQTGVFRSIEHWTADWRSALFADRLASQHPHLAIVAIDEDSVADLPYRSPWDRSRLARLVTRLDEAGARVIALDVLIDQPTEATKDAELLAAVAKARDKVVLASVDERVKLEEGRRAYLERFIADTGATAGDANVRIELDGTIRAEADAARGGVDSAARRPGFATAVARKAGVAVAGPSARVAWLGRPRDGSDTFRVISARLIAAPRDDERQVAALELGEVAGRVVLVGGDLDDQGDRHVTPLSKLGRGSVPGVEVHAHVVAQSLDNRRIGRIPPPVETAVVLVMAVAGTLVGWLLGPRSYGMRNVLPIVLVALADAILFSLFRTIMPFAAPIVAWVSGAALGRAAGWFAARAGRM